MIGRMVGLLGLVAAFVLTVQLRGSNLIDPSPHTAVTMAVFLVGVAFLAAVISGGVLARPRNRRKPVTYGNNPRQTFRIVYPETEQPRFALSGSPIRAAATLRVIDVSEEGLRVADNTGLSEGSEVRGELQFASGRTAQVAGKVVRRTDRDASFQLTTTVPPELIVAEQLRLRKQERSDRA